MDFPNELLSTLRQTNRITIFTGAGISAESGISTFRDKMTGLWERYQAEDLASAEAFRRDPALVWGWYEWRRMTVLRAQPNPGHLAISALAGRVPEITIVTQNVDDLHERAGSHDVVHLHGSLHRPRCFACARPFALPLEIPDEPEGGRKLEPPRCLRCGGRVRPGVVWFGESMPTAEWKAAEKAAKGCDLFFSIGTSSVVYPAAVLPFLAHDNGATVVQVNPHPTDLDAVADFTLRHPAGEGLPALIMAAWPGGTAERDLP